MRHLHPSPNVLLLALHAPSFFGLFLGRDSDVKSGPSGPVVFSLCGSIITRIPVKMAEPKSFFLQPTLSKKETFMKERNDEAAQARSACRFAGGLRPPRKGLPIVLRGCRFADGFSWCRPAPVEKMADGQYGVAREHPRPGKAHDVADLRAHRLAVAVDLAFCARRLALLEGTGLEPGHCVIVEGLAAVAERAFRAVLFAAVQADHRRDGPALAADAGPRSGHGACHRPLL